MAESNIMTSLHDTTNLRRGLVRLRGINWPWMVTEETLDALKTYEVREDDVWVTTYPKSGTHWAAEIINLILVDGHEDRIDRSRDAPPIEFDFSHSRLPPRQRQHTSPLYKVIEEWEAPRVITTHLPEEMMPTQIYQGKGKVVFIIRNPKDTVLSGWYFVQTRKFDSKFEDWGYFFQEFLKGQSLYGSWFDYVLNFWSKHRHDKNFLFLTYEDMKKDTRGVIIQIADFLGKPLSEDAIDRVVELCSLRSMKTRFRTVPSSEDKDTVPSTSETATGSAPSGAPVGEGAGKKVLGATSMIRKGIIGDWKSKLTVAQNEALDAMFEEKIAGSGLKIQFQ